MPDEDLDESQMPLYEFINLPTTISFYYWYTNIFQNFLEKRPYIRLGRVLVNELAILYTNEKYMDQIFTDLGSDFLNIYPEIYGLTGKEALESAGILQVQQQPYLNLTGKGTTIAIIDTGIDYTQPIFRYEDGTSKIKYIWDQTTQAEPNDLDVNFGTV